MFVICDGCGKVHSSTVPFKQRQDVYVELARLNWKSSALSDEGKTIDYCPQCKDEHHGLRTSPDTPALAPEGEASGVERQGDVADAGARQ